MAKKNQILRIPQKKYVEAAMNEPASIELPHEKLIPAEDKEGTNTGGSGDTGVSGDTSIGIRNFNSRTENASTSYESEVGKAAPTDINRSLSGDAGYTSTTSVSNKAVDGVSLREVSGELKGRARDVWRYFCRAVEQKDVVNNRVRVSRRQIQKESGVGSLNTIDSAISMLQGRGWLRVHPLPGSNEGYEYEVLLDRRGEGQGDTPKLVADALRSAARAVERKAGSITPEQLNKWSRIAHQTNRLAEELK